MAERIKKRPKKLKIRHFDTNNKLYIPKVVGVENVDFEMNREIKNCQRFLFSPLLLLEMAERM